MSIQKLPIEAVQKVRQYIQKSLVLPESENHPRQTGFTSDEEMPEPDSLYDLGTLFNFAGPVDEDTLAPNTQGRWFISATNPGAALIKLPGLKLKPGLRIVSYLQRTGDSGTGVTWAIPEPLSTTAQLENALAKRGDRDQPPCPEGALENFMEAIEGDRSPASFVVASILRRELLEFGAVGKGCQWTHHRLINAIPAQASWQWKSGIPKDLSPKVLVAVDGKVAVEFFTCRIVAPVAIFRHLDQYRAGQYQAVCLDQAIAALAPRK